MPARPHPRTHVTLLCAAVLAAVLTALLPAGQAHAAGRTVQGGRLDWGIKSSFQSYVTGPIANGSFSLTGGAATVGGSQFRFHSATGTYDGSSGAFDAGFSGGVHFLGHKEDDGTYQLDLTISRPTVRLAGNGGTLYVDIISKAKGTGAVTTSSQVPFASLSLGGIDMKGGGNAVQLNNLPATLTAQGAKSFAGYYTAGTALDPVSLSADVRAAATGSTGKPSASPTPSTSPSKSKAKKETSGRIEDGAVDWGVRRTFREYVTGAIAQGEWELSDGAQDGGALFRFPEGSGTYDEKKRTLDASFTGAVRFTGEQGLDLKLGGIRAEVTDDGKGTLYADVTSASKTGKAGGGGTGKAGGTDKEVPLVTFTAKELKPKDGLAQVTEAPAKLTAAGAEAFGGMYKAGTEMDPVSLAVALDDKAELPALPDLGSAESATPEAAAAEPKKAGPKTEATASDADLPVLPIGLTVASLVAIAAAFLIIRRRRTPQTAATAAAAPDAPDAPDEN
ncbi:HtaA domain-containing protein [Streptomyces tauricus]|uniref:HtaA domain-containing protein n=1 Tax=Streptomyces tauricus TaxID=68274 RepID=UPI002242FB2A|nr:HtaA domain-containing protein [Streptomyces tauricus]MCW8101333.1 HtaA domain-containing protein [Streptomyces tauricus]